MECSAPRLNWRTFLANEIIMSAKSICTTRIAAADWLQSNIDSEIGAVCYWIRLWPIFTVEFANMAIDRCIST